MKKIITTTSGSLILAGIIFRILAFAFKDTSAHNTFALIGLIAVVIGIILAIIESIKERSIKKNWIVWILFIVWVATCVLTTK